MGYHLSYGITQCYLPPNTSECAPTLTPASKLVMDYLPQMDGGLSWPRLPGNPLAGSQTHDLLIKSPTP